MGQVDTVKAIYAAFGQGNVPAILEHLAEDVTWDIDSTVPEVPWLQPRKGRANVSGFFESLEPIQFTTFNPHTFFENGNKVFVLIEIVGTFPANQKSYEFKNEGHLWTFNDAGLVVDYVHVTDTHRHWLAHRGE